MSSSSPEVKAPPGDGFEVSGGFIRAYQKTLTALLLLDRVLHALPADTQEILASPPMSWTWMDGRHGTDVLETLLMVTSREQVKDFGLKLAQLQIGPILTPVVRTVMAVSSATPRALAKSLPLMMRPFLKGIAFSDEDVGPTAYRLTVRYPRSIGEANYLCWEGLLPYAFQISGTRGTVVRAPTGPSSATSVYDLAWSR